MTIDHDHAAGVASGAGAQDVRARLSAERAGAAQTFRSVQRWAAAFAVGYTGLTALAIAAHAGWPYVVGFLAITAAYAFGAVSLPDHPEQARWALAVGGIMSAPLGLVMAYQSRRLRDAAQRLEAARSGRLA